MRRAYQTTLLLAAVLTAASIVVGCSSPASTASVPVFATQPAPATVVSGGAASFTVAATANGTLAYQWRKDGSNLSGAVDSTFALTAVTAANAGVYDCIATNTVGAASQVAVSSGAILSVNTAPAIAAQPVDQTAIVGGQAIFMVAVSGNGTLSYQWQKDGTSIAGATKPSYIIASVTTADAGAYSCVVTNTLGSTTTSTTSGAAALAVTAPLVSPSTPVISSQPASVTVVSGAPASFSVSASANGTLSYQWRKDGAMLADETDATLSLDAVSGADAGSYDCIVTNTKSGASQIAVSSGALLAINIAPVIAAQPVDATTAAGGQVVFMVAATGNGALSYQWNKDGVAILGATLPTYIIQAAALADAGSYSCGVTNTLGSTTTATVSAAAVLQVTAGQAQPPTISTQPASLTVASGGAASFTVEASGAGTLSYQWRKDGAMLVGATSATLSIATVTSADKGVYDCIVTDSLGGTTAIAISTGAVLSVNDAPVILAQPLAQAVVAGGSATFTVVATGSGTLTYQWRKDQTAIPGATGANYTVSSVQAADVGTYDCIVTSTLADTVTSTTTTGVGLAIITSPLITAQSGTETVAEGGAASFSVTASGAGLSYQWYMGSTALTDGARVSGSQTATLSITGLVQADAANYSCLVSDGVTTRTSNAAALVVVATPVIATSPAAITVADGGTGAFSVSATSANGTLSYQWRVSTDDGASFTAISGATSSTLQLSSVSTANAGSYDCVVTNTIEGVTNSITSSSAALTINTSVSITSQPASLTQSQGGTATMTVVASGAPGSTLSYQWAKNAVAITGATQSSLTLSNVTGTDAASYTCTVTSTLGGTATSVTSAVAVLAINTTPVIVTAPLMQGVATGSAATFSVAATSTGTLSYQWRKTLSSVVTNVGLNQNSYTTPTITGANIATYDGATYDCVITSTLGTPSTTTSVDTTPVALNVAVLPTLTVASSAGATPNNFVGGEAAPTLTATVTNSAPALNGTVTYQWKKGNINILGATNTTYTLPAAIAAADFGSYICMVTNTHNGAVASTPSTAIVINVLSAPVISTDLPPVKYQNGTTNPTNSSLSVIATAPAGGTLSYLWQMSADSGATFTTVSGATSATYAAPAYQTGTPPRQYKVVVTNTVGAGTATTTSATCTVTLYQTAAITGQPAAANVVAGSPASFTVAPTAITITGTAQSFQWYKGFSTTVGVAIPGATSATLSIASAEPGDAGYYYVIVTNSLPGAISGSFSTATSNIVRLGVNTAPTIVTQPPAAPIATEATSFSLAVSATGSQSAALAYQWQKGGSNIAGAIGATYTIPSPAAGDAGSYTCVITSTLAGTAAQTATTNPANLVVNLKPTNLTPVVTGNNTTGPITIAVTPTNLNSGSYLTYAWKRDGTAITGAVRASYTINEVTATSAGNYTCDVSSVFVATATSNSSTATATSPIAAVGTGSGTTPVVTMAASYTAGKTGIAISTATQTGATYEWSVTNGSITAGTGTNAITVTAGSSVALPMTLTVVVSNGAAGAVGTASATIVAAVTQPQLLAPASVHPGDTWMQASIDSQSGATYSWNVTGAGSITNAAPSNQVNLPFSVNSGAVSGNQITLAANVQNSVGDAAPSASKSVAVTTGTFIGKDAGSGINWLLGTGSNTLGAAAALLANGRVLICGGQTISAYTPAAAAIYDPSTGRWTRVADMNQARTGHTATALNNGTILVTGGTGPVNGISTYLNNAEIYDPIANTWTLVTSSNMGTGRLGHTATLLSAGANAGKVAIIGGRFSSGDYSPTISIFQPSGSAGNNPGGSFSNSPVGLILPRALHTATQLSDGRVLIVGGQGPTNETFQQAEIFDATSSTTAAWSITRVGSLTTQPRLYHSATLLLDGRVLVTAGQSSPNTAEIFDPSNDSFTATANTLKGGYLAANSSGRYQHAATRLSDGRVLFTGGQGGSSQGVSQSAEIFDPTAGTFTSVTPMNGGRSFHDALLLNNGTVLVMGGTGPTLSSTSSTEIFDPTTNAGLGSWTTIGAPARSQATANFLPSNGLVMVVGGQNERGGSDPSTSPASNVSVSGTTHLYNPATGVWTNGTPLATARRNHVAVVLANGKLLVAGGNGAQTIGGSTNLASAELYDPAANTWSSAGNMQTARSSFGMIALPDGRALVMGGLTSTGPYANSAELYDPTANSWSFTTCATNCVNGPGQTTMSEVKAGPTPVLLSNGTVVVAGGDSPDSSTVTAAVELFDPVSQNWTVLNPLSQARDHHFPVALPSGKFVLVGGRVVNPAFGVTSGVGAPNGLPGAVEIYDTLAMPAAGGQGATLPTATNFFNTGSWVSVGTLLSNGKVLLAGGTITTTASTYSSTAEIYDPIADALSVGPAMPVGQGSGLISVTLANGNVMTIGGSQSNAVTQIYHP